MKVSISISPEVKALATEASKADRRTMSALIELLVLEHAPKIIEARKGLNHNGNSERN